MTFAGQSDIGSNAADWLLPQQHRDLVGIVGRDAALLLAGAVFDPARRYGLQYVPAVAAGTSFERIAGLIGDQAARQLCASMGGSELRFPPATAFVNRVRDASVRDHWRDSTLAAKWIAWLHDITERQVRNICRGEPRLARPAALALEKAARMRPRAA
nr:hypothetical protein [Stenotrophomonas acidaminiphila]